MALEYTYYSMDHWPIKTWTFVQHSEQQHWKKFTFQDQEQFYYSRKLSKEITIILGCFILLWSIVCCLWYLRLPPGSVSSVLIHCPFTPTRLAALNISWSLWITQHNCNTILLYPKQWISTVLCNHVYLHPPYLSCRLSSVCPGVTIFSIPYKML